MSWIGPHHVERRLRLSLTIVGIVVLALLPVAVLLGSRAILQQHKSNVPAGSAAVQPALPLLPLQVDMTGDGAGWGVVVASASQLSQPLHVAVTTDAGTNWRSVLKLPPGNVFYLHGFAGRGAVVIWSQPSKGKGGAEPVQELLYSTPDGGQTWLSHPLPAGTATLRAVSFVSPDDGWFIGADPASPSARYLWHTSNAGKTWQRLGNVSGALTIRFIDARTGFIGGPTEVPGTAPDLRLTHDSGRTWTPAHLLLPPTSSRYPGITSTVSVQPAGASALVAVVTVAAGSQGVGAPESLVVYVSTDGGATWTTPALVWFGMTALAGIPSFAAASTTTWTVAFGDHVMSTDNGGQAWRTSPLPVPGGYRAADAAFTSASDGFILALPQGTCLACAGILLATDDGGLSWRVTSGQTPAAATPSAPPPSAASGKSASGKFPTRCAVADLRLGVGDRVSEPTGQHTLSLILTNVSPAGCHLLGYPRISLIDAAGDELPLAYVDTGDQVVTGELPVWVDLEPGATGYVTVNQYRCDAGIVTASASLNFQPPDSSSWLHISDVGGAYCGAGDAGSIVHVSPVEPSFAATLSHH